MTNAIVAETVSVYRNRLTSAQVAMLLDAATRCGCLCRVVQSGDCSYLMQRVCFRGCDGFHPRAARSFGLRLGLEILSARWMAEGRSEGWTTAEYGVYACAGPGDVIFFRSRRRAALESVLRWFQTDPVATEARDPGG